MYDDSHLSITEVTINYICLVNEYFIAKITLIKRIIALRNKEL